MRGGVAKSFKINNQGIRLIGAQEYLRIYKTGFKGCYKMLDNTKLDRLEV